MTDRFAPRRRRGAGAVLLSILVFLAALATPALSQEDDGSAPVKPPELVLIDATDDPFMVVRTGAAPSSVQVTTNGLPAEVGTPVAVSQSNLPVQTAIVIDNSSESSEWLDAFKQVADEYLAAAPANEDITVWTTGGTARMRVGLNTDHDRNALIVDGILSASGSNHLWDGVRGATLGFEDPVAGATNVLILTANIDAGSTSTDVLARGAALANDTSVFMIHGGESTWSDDADIVSVSAAGAFALVENPEELSAYGPSLTAAIANTYVIPFSGDGVEIGSSIDITVDGTIINGSYSVGAATSGRALAPIIPPEPTTIPGLDFLSGNTAKNLGIVFGILAAMLGTFSMVLLFQKNQSGLNDMLEAYADPYGEGEEDGNTSLLQSSLVKRAVAITEDMAERQGALERAEALLERADLPLRAGEALTAWAGIVLAALAVGVLMFGGLIGIAFMGVLGVFVPPIAVKFIAGRRTKAFLQQLPDMLQLLSSTLKAGYSFMQGIEAVSHETEDPMGGEMRRIVTEAQLGRPIEEAMDASATRMESPDFAWCVMAVKIQREVGGNLSELLLTVADTMTARERMRRDIASLTAEGKMSAIVLAALPCLLGLAMWALNPEYIETLFTDSLGKVLLGASITSALIGFAWMKKIIAIEI
ncbi:MAG: type II secretion system F family protein [Actinomycetota bacterium]